MFTVCFFSVFAMRILKIVSFSAIQVVPENLQRSRCVIVFFKPGLADGLLNHLIGSW